MIKIILLSLFSISALAQQINIPIGIGQTAPIVIPQATLKGTASKSGSVIVNFPQTTLPAVPVTIDPQSISLSGLALTFTLKNCAVSKDTTGNLTISGTPCTVLISAVK